MKKILDNLNQLIAMVSSVLVMNAIPFAYIDLITRKEAVTVIFAGIITMGMVYLIEQKGCRK